MTKELRSDIIEILDEYSRKITSLDEIIKCIGNIVDESYGKGCQDIWELCKNLYCGNDFEFKLINDSKELEVSSVDFNNIFPVSSFRELLEFPIKEIINQIANYKMKPRIGDLISFTFASKDYYGVVINTGVQWIEVLLKDRNTCILSEHQQIDSVKVLKHNVLESVIELAMKGEDKK